MNIEDQLENQLRDALRRQDPSPGFANRVIARAQPAPPARKPPIRMWGPAVGAIAAVLVAGIGFQEYRQQQKAEQARDQAELALRIAAEKLVAVQSKVFQKLDRGNRE